MRTVYCSFQHKVLASNREIPSLILTSFIILLFLETDMKWSSQRTSLGCFLCNFDARDIKMPGGGITKNLHDLENDTQA